eukprot:CAMPEP_0204256542 /NCGR_PEP_ID=MMETSP0468-20130131/3846_1 /ASSEMBLY_ACC=CAM_ASM_000383 /TAXON_ID=2969 /ORGANISM="Oxyrrhis marina" /LENGTH=84 /DNA_ID=CAMNT_0051230511 /DNA_START=44 /DNA_END=299 /DNA_ORIENTATION=+
MTTSGDSDFWVLRQLTLPYAANSGAASSGSRAAPAAKKKASAKAASGPKKAVKFGEPLTDVQEVESYKAYNSDASYGKSCCVVQ